MDVNQFFCQLQVICSKYSLRAFKIAKKPIPERFNDKEIIVSLASWKQRFAYLPPVFDSLLRQHFKPDRIIVWLDEEDESQVPNQVMDYTNQGIEIRFTKNIMSYKKLIPVYKAYPEAIVITVDDDVIYPPDLVQNLYLSYCKYPNKIHANRCRHFWKDENGRWCKYNLTKAIKSKKELIDGNLLFTGIAGVLYPGREAFHDDFFNEELFKKLTPTNDDPWFWYMAKLKGTEVCKIKNQFIPSAFNMILGSNKVGLWNQNVVSDSEISQNDTYLENLRKHYKI